MLLARNHVDLPCLVDAGAWVDIPVWAVVDSWPDDDRADLNVGVRSDGRDWLTQVDQEDGITG